MMIDGIPNRPLYFYQKDIIVIGGMGRLVPSILGEYCGLI